MNVILNGYSFVFSEIKCELKCLNTSMRTEQYLHYYYTIILVQLKK